MNAMKSLTYPLLFSLLLVATAANAQDQRNDNFNQAKLHLANHKLNMAIPILERLWGQDPQNANLNYLLGLCYVKEDTNIAKSVELLESASAIYTTNYESGSNKERRAPEYVYYYLTIAYSKNNQCEKALGALNKFYQVYTYQDEYYLVDGQKWVRECNLEKKEEKLKEEAPALVQRVSEDEEAPVVKEPEVAVVEEPVKVKEVQKDKTPAVEVIADDRQPTVESEEPEPAKAVAAVAPKPEPRFKERLVPFSDWEKLRTRAVDYTTMSSLYGVQIASLIDLKPTRDFEGVKNVEVYVDENGVFRYVIGRFSYRSQAESLMKKVRERGYDDAFIVDVNQPNYNTEVLGLGAENINWSITGKIDFRVQIGAFRTIIPSAVAEKYLEVDGIRENKQNDLTVLTVGSFEYYEDAASFRDELIANGIEDAFVVSFNYGRKVPLKESIQYTKGVDEGATDQDKEAQEKAKQRKREAADF